MGIKYDAISYEMPWRPNYELKISFAWFGAAVVAIVTSSISSLPAFPFYVMAVVSFFMGLGQIKMGLRLKTLQKNLAGRPLEFMELGKVDKMLKAHPDELWLGNGFEWENRHTQRAFEILKRDTSAIQTSGLKKAIDRSEVLGFPWIHGVEPDEKPIYQPLKHSQGHTLIIGTTGSGKTRMFDTLISQAILRGEACIIIDPKGDKELADCARETCEYLGEPERFIYFHPGFAEKSVRFDMMRNFSRGTELATRIANLIPSETGNDPFTAFGWNSLNNLIQGLLILDERPNLTKLRNLLDSGSHELLSRCIQKYAQDTFGMAEYYVKVNPYLDAVKKNTHGAMAIEMIRFYMNEVKPVNENIDLEGLITMIRHDSGHFSKMVASLLPVMSMLTAGTLAELLSPTVTNADDSRLIMDTQKAIRDRKVVYIGLDSLSDNKVGSAIGSLLLSDLTAVAGSRYNYGVDNQFVNVFVDESCEVLNDSFIQLLNKGRGSLIRLFVATQTIADFEARLGSKAKALQVLGNINNTISLRVIDNDTQAYITDNLPTTRVRYIMRSQDQGSHADNPFHHSGSQGERLLEEESPLFLPQLLGSLPNLEFIAKISGGRIYKGRLPILGKDKKN